MLNIRNFAEFQSLMTDTLQETKNYINQFPEITVYKNLLDQLSFIKSILIDEKKIPTMAQINSTYVGMIAIKNFDDDAPLYSEKLKEINYAFYEYSKVPYLRGVLK